MKHYVAIKDDQVIGHLYAKNIKTARAALRKQRVKAVVTLGYKTLPENRIAEAPVLLGEKPVARKAKPPEGTRRCITIASLPVDVANYLDQQPSRAKYAKQLIIQDYKKTVEKIID